MSAFGPKRTFLFALHMSAFGGEADICFALHILLMTRSGYMTTAAQSHAKPQPLRLELLPYVNLFRHAPLDGGRIAIGFLPDCHLHYLS